MNQGNKNNREENTGRIADNKNGRTYQSEGIAATWFYSKRHTANDAHMRMNVRTARLEVMIRVAGGTNLRLRRAFIILVIDRTSVLHYG